MNTQRKTKNVPGDEIAGYNMDVAVALQEPSEEAGSLYEVVLFYVNQIHEEDMRSGVKRRDEYPNQLPVKHPIIAKWAALWKEHVTDQKACLRVVSSIFDNVVPALPTYFTERQRYRVISNVLTDFSRTLAPAYREHFEYAVQHTLGTVCSWSEPLSDAFLEVTGPNLVVRLMQEEFSARKSQRRANNVLSHGQLQTKSSETTK